MSQIEAEYQSRINAMSGRERVARSLAMLKWTREMIARQIVAEQGEISQQCLQWEVALRLYGADRTTRRMIESELADVSH